MMRAFRHIAHDFGVRAVTQPSLHLDLLGLTIARHDLDDASVSFRQKRGVRHDENVLFLRGDDFEIRRHSDFDARIGSDEIHAHHIRYNIIDRLARRRDVTHGPLGLPILERIGIDLRALVFLNLGEVVLAQFQTDAERIDVHHFDRDRRVRRARARDDVHRRNHTRERRVERRILELAQEMAREALAETRRSIWNLRLPTLEHATLSDALQGVVAHQSNATMTMTFETCGEMWQLSPAEESTLLRVRQEALVNVTKHPNATHVQVLLEYAPAFIVSPSITWQICRSCPNECAGKNRNISIRIPSHDPCSSARTESNPQTAKLG